MAAGKPVFASLMAKASSLDQMFSKTNPNRETTLPDGVYYAVLKRLSGRSIGKANEEQYPAVGLEGHFLSDKEGVQDQIYGQGFSSIFVFKETEKQSLSDAFSRFIFFLQDSLLIDTTGWKIRDLATRIDEINTELLDKEVVVVQVTVKLGDNGRKNVNVANRAVTAEELEQIGVNLDQLGDVDSGAGDDGSGEGEGEYAPDEVATEELTTEEVAPEVEPEVEPAPEPEPEPVRPAAKKAAAKASTPVARPTQQAPAAKKAAAKQAFPLRRPVR